MMVGFSSLHLSLWPLSDLLEHYPLVIWGVFTCVVVVAVYERTCLEVELSSFHWSVKFTIAESDPITVDELSCQYLQSLSGKILPSGHPRKNFS